MTGRPPRISLLTTFRTNIGDDLAREGVLAVLDRAAPGYSALLIDKWSQASLHERLDGEREDAADKYWESDLFVIAGAPAYWHLTHGRHRSPDAQWHKWIYADRALAGGDADHPALLALGVGSGQPWADPGAAFVNDAQCAAFAKELGWRAAATVVRDSLASSILTRLEVPHCILPCPSFLAPRRRDPIAADSRGPIGVNLMHLGGEFALDPEFSPPSWRRRCTDLLAGLRTLRPLAFIAHDEADQRFMESLAPGERILTSKDWKDFDAFYSTCSAVVSNRVHGALYAAGRGIPSIIVGNDSRALCGEPVGLPIERAATVTPEAIVERTRALLADRDTESARLLALSDRTLEAYAEVVRPVIAELRGSPHTPAAPAPAAPLEPKLAFITGCGRSGTTILGRILEHHGQVRYFNDRFDLWVRPFPVTDIWGYHPGSALAMPRVALDADDARVRPEALEWFRGLLEHERGDRPVLVEKLAINNFRLGFICALCPEARVINIVRHGVEVAYSIAAKADLGQWYGENDRKWRLLVEYAWAHGYGHLLSLCTTPYHKGLLEWRMSVDAADRFFAHSPSPLSTAPLHVRYEELLADPVSVCSRLREFLGLARSEGMLRFAQDQVKRQNPAAAQRPIPRGTEEIAGEALHRLGYWP